ncbi:hypothetical protein [Nocardia carnea]|uniref:Uncharacterized protein n=1 Tax=Nocardia carnea TaxID=37328 RepID=A0ABW7TQE6_9NOCA|nr:hypothetical protein [Nocardia carnea]
MSERLMEPVEAVEMEWIDYAEFGERFVTHAVTESRIEAAVAGITGRGLSIGPFNLGPAGLAGFRAEGRIGRPEVVRRGSRVSFDVRIPVSLAAKILLGGRRLGLETVVSIDLTFHARTADPLLIVIDIPEVRRSDVRVLLRLAAADSVAEWMLDPISGLLQNEVANRVNAMLCDPGVMRSRIYDVEAIVDGRRSPHRRRTEFEWIDYAEFGRRFFPWMVTRERLGGFVAYLAGRPIEIGPFRTGPRAAAEVTVRGEVGQPLLTDLPAAPAADGDIALVRFDLTVPVSLDITVNVLKDNRYRADLEIPLVLTAHAADPLLIVVEVDPPAREDVRLEYAAQGMRAAALGVLGGIRKQIIAQVVRVVRAELSDPATRTLDVAARIDRLL